MRGQMAPPKKQAPKKATKKPTKKTAKQFLAEKKPWPKSERSVTIVRTEPAESAEKPKAKPLLATTPGITLTATLDDISGAAAGTAANPSKMIIALAGYGPTLPRIVGTAMIAKTGPFAVYSTGGQISIQLWGNDALFPAGTYYAITILDGDDNVVQCGAYQFVGSETIDLSNAPQIYPTTPSSPNGIPVLTNPQGQALQTIDGSITIEGNLIVTGTFDFGGLFIVPIVGGVAEFNGATGSGQSLTLTQSVTSTAANFTPGNPIMTLVKQNATGGFALTWPDLFKNPPEVNPAPLGATTQLWMLDEDGNYWPFGGATWS